jgi:CRISPR-associated protein Cmr6
MARHNKKKHGKKQPKVPQPITHQPSTSPRTAPEGVSAKVVIGDPLQQLPQLVYSSTDANQKRQRESSILETESNHVPMEYRAQIPGRCQRQYISDETMRDNSKTSDAGVWLQEWSMGSSETPLGNPFQVEYKASSIKARIRIQQRLVSNCGTDAGLIRPVLSSGGWPLIPGSSIKGLFRRECLFRNDARVVRWCGSACGQEPVRQGLLRFHSSFPQDGEWKRENMIYSLDLAHPQWKWQLGAQDLKHSAFALISILKPELLIPISSADETITEDEWRDIHEILKDGIQRQGIGGRTSAGYGVSAGMRSEQLLFECSVLGRGSASKLLSEKPEFRPTMFRAAIRSMALRVFGGLCDEKTAEREVDVLFGGITGQHPCRGLLAFRYIDLEAPHIEASKTRFSFPVFKASGTIQWALNPVARYVDSEESENLRLLLVALHGLVMTLGGFGKSWRRIDHQFFGSSLQGGYNKAPIGCHWQWLKRKELPDILQLNSQAGIKQLLNTARQCVQKRLGTQSSNASAPWQEVVHPERMLIWTREAKDISDSKAMEWLHAKHKDSHGLPSSLCLHRTDMGGRLKNARFNDGNTCVSRVWHRMYPLQDRDENRSSYPADVRPVSNPSVFQRGSRGSIPRPTGQQTEVSFWNGPFLETFVLFPYNQNSIKGDMVPGAGALVKQLDSDQGPASDFQRLRW